MGRIDVSKPLSDKLKATLTEWANDRGIALPEPEPEYPPGKKPMFVPAGWHGIADARRTELRLDSQLRQDIKNRERISGTAATFEQIMIRNETLRIRNGCHEHQYQSTQRVARVFPEHARATAEVLERFNASPRGDSILDHVAYDPSLKDELYWLSGELDRRMEADCKRHCGWPWKWPDCEYHPKAVEVWDEVDA